MGNYLYCMSSTDPDPVYLGDMVSWFMFYKWRPDEDDEVFVPLPKDRLPEIASGDTLWFMVDGDLFGRVKVLRTCPDYPNDRKEIWFRTQDCERVPATMRFPFVLTNHEVFP